MAEIFAFIRMVFPWELFIVIVIIAIFTAYRLWRKG